MEELERQPTFGAPPQYNHNVFTPPAGASSTKNFNLKMDDQGRVVPLTEREAEGELPLPNRTPCRQSPNRSMHLS